MGLYLRILGCSTIYDFSSHITHSDPMEIDDISAKNKQLHTQTDKPFLARPTNKIATTQCQSGGFQQIVSRTQCGNGGFQ